MEICDACGARQVRQARRLSAQVVIGQCGRCSSEQAFVARQPSGRVDRAGFLTIYCDSAAGEIES